MTTFANVGGIQGIVGSLTGVNVPAGAIAQIVAIIEPTYGPIDNKAPISAVHPAWFGGSQSGGTLAIHTEKARATLTNAIIEAVASLQGTTTAMTDYDHVLTQKDEDSFAAAQALVAKTDSAVGQMDGNRHTPLSPPPATPGEDGP